MEDAYRTERLLGIVSAHGGIDRAAADSVLAAAFALLAGRLGGDAAADFAAAVPRRYAGAPATTESRGDLTAAFARRTGVPLERAREHAAAACRAIAEVLPDDVVDSLRAAVPPEWAGWLSAPSEAADPRAHAARATLAEGRPGSSHPLSEARPDNAHAHSVVRSDDPHGDTKLSGASDIGGEPVSTARPGSHRPLSDSER